MDNLEEKLPESANTAEAEVKEEVKEVATDLGKFKDVKALMRAYESLQAEFTRRSQRLKELEANNAPQAPVPNTATATAPSQSQQPELTRADFLSAAVQDEEVRKNIISSYVSSLVGGKSVPLVTAGVQTVTERKKLSSVKEASRLARNFLNQN